MSVTNYYSLNYAGYGPPTPPEIRVQHLGTFVPGDVIQLTRLATDSSVTPAQIIEQREARRLPICLLLSFEPDKKIRCLVFDAGHSFKYSVQSIDINSYGGIPISLQSIVFQCCSNVQHVTT